MAGNTSARVNDAAQAFFAPVNQSNVDIHTPLLPLGHLLEPVPNLRVDQDQACRTSTEADSRSSTGSGFEGDLSEWPAHELFNGILQMRRLLAGSPNANNPVSIMRNKPSIHFQATRAEYERVWCGEEKTLEGRFHQNISLKVMQAFDQAREPNSSSGTAIGLGTGPLKPDIAVREPVRKTAVSCGELKTAWTFRISALARAGDLMFTDKLGMHTLTKHAAGLWLDCSG